MGFLKFLQRGKKKEEFDELDLPPAPPPVEGFDEFPSQDFKDFGDGDLDFQKAMGSENTQNPGFPEKDEFPELGVDDFSDQKRYGTSEPQFDFTDKELDVPDFPEIAEKESEFVPEDSDRLQPEIPELPEQHQVAVPEVEGIDQISRKAQVQEKRIVSGSMFMRVDKFKSIIGHINVIRSDLRNTEGGLMKLEEIKNTKYRSFEKIRASLYDVQKKIIFIDKTLFKGD